MFPAEALAEELAGRGWRIVLATDRRGEAYAERFPAEERLALNAGTGSGPLGMIRAGGAILKGVGEARAAFDRLKPDVVVGFGGYPSAPALLAALIQGRPTAIHEQNAVLGRTNRLLAPRVRAVTSAFPTLERATAAVKARARVVGIPVRPAIRALHDRAYDAPTPGGPIEVLVTGGSQGARILAETVPRALAALPAPIRTRLRVAQQARPETLNDARAVYGAAEITAAVQPFFSDMAERLGRAHLVIGRAGASTCAELAIAGRPSILIPLAIATDDHQTLNARLLSDVDAAAVIAERDLTPQRLSAVLSDWMSAPEQLVRRARAAHAVGLPDAARALADLVEAAAQSR